MAIEQAILNNDSSVMLSQLQNYIAQHNLVSPPLAAANRPDEAALDDFKVAWATAHP